MTAGAGDFPAPFVFRAILGERSVRLQIEGKGAPVGLAPALYGAGISTGTPAKSGPELIDPQVEVHEAIVPDRVDPPGSLIFHCHELAFEQRLEVLRDRRSADGQTFRQLVDRAWLAAQFFEKIAPVGIGNGLKSIHGHAGKLNKTIQTGKSFVCAAHIALFFTSSPFQMLKGKNSWCFS